MNKPWRIWLIFGLCLIVVLAAMAWISIMTLQLEKDSLVEENVRLALWRMESDILPIIIEESSRSYFTYNSFYSTEQTYSPQFTKITRGEVLVPSPLLTQQSPFVLLHFQFEPGGKVTSPQVPVNNMRDRV